MFKVGIDLGGTKIEIITLDDTNKVVYRERIPTEANKGYEAILERIALLYKRTAERINQAQHTLGIGIPGTISAKTGLVKNANTVCLNGKPLREDLETRIKRPLAIQNDANCFTLAEALLGAAVGHQVVFGVIMGTGCGGGIAFDGKVHSGIQGIAGEWGHMQIDPLGPHCYCGKRGCVETYISGGGVQQLYRERFSQLRTVQEIVAGYRSGKPDCSLIFQEFLGHFGTALANVIDVIDPDIVVLGGGLSNIPELYTLGREEVDKQIFSDGLETPIVPNQLGDSAGVFGAAMIGV